MIITYAFYTDGYYGDIIPENLFEKYKSRAVDDISTMVSGHIWENEEYEEKKQKAVCALAELLYRIDGAEKQGGVNADGTGKVIKSRTSGNESISYDTGKNMVSAVITDVSACNRLKYETVRTYLSGTGLLYAGV